MNEAGVRLPGLVFGFLAMLTTGLLAWRMFGRTTGVVAAIFYATMVMPTALAQVAAHDVALIPWINMAVLLFWEADRVTTHRKSLALATLTGLFLGLACLTKGLVGIGLVGTAYGLYLLLTRRLTVAACVRGAIALTVAALVASSWYVAMERRNPGYLHYYFVDRHLLGFATETQRHGHQPFWYYVPILLGGGLPWIIYLPVAVRDWWASWTGQRPGALSARKLAAALAARVERPSSLEPDQGGAALLWCWLLGCTILLSIANSKLVTYIWPVFPPMAVLAARVWGRRLEGRLNVAAQAWFTWCLGPSTVLAPLVLPVGMCLAEAVLGIRFGGAQWALGMAAALTAWTTLPFWRRGHYRGVLISGTLSMAVQFAAGMALAAPPFAAVNTARDLARYFNRLGRVPAQVIVIDERVGSVVFYLDPNIRRSLKSGQLESVGAADLRSMQPRDSDRLIVLADWNAPKASQYCDLNGLAFQRWGPYRLFTPLKSESLPCTAVRGSSCMLR
jgi:4-amino-4-deoxy-L-arabinose transferase